MRRPIGIERTGSVSVGLTLSRMATTKIKDEIIRVARRKRFVVTDLTLVRDKRLSWAARGLLNYLLSLPDNWKIRPEALATQSPANITAVRSLLKELAKFRYMMRLKYKAEDGTFGWRTIVSERPLTDEQIGTYSSPQIPLPFAGTPSAGFPCVEQPGNGATANGEPGDISKTKGKEGSGESNNDAKEEQKRISLAMQARVYFDLWKQVMNHPETELDDKRKALIIKRLKAGDTIEKLHKSTIGYRINPFHRGKNKAKTIHDKVSLICRDSEHVEAGLGYYEKRYGNVYPPPTETGSVPDASFNSELAAFVFEQCIAGVNPDEVLKLAVEKFGEEHRDAATQTIEFFNQAKAELT